MRSTSIVLKTFSFLAAFIPISLARIGLLHMSTIVSQQSSKNISSETIDTDLAKFLNFDYKPQGSFVKLQNEVEFYGTGSTKSKNGVIIIPDAFGFQGGNVKNIGDFIGSIDTCVAIPTVLGSPTDAHDTKSYFESKSLGEYTKSQIIDGNMKPKVASIAKYMFDQGVEKIALIGFSWGGWVVANLLASDISDCFVCGVLAHPSINLEERMYGGALVELFAKIQRPLLVLPARGDPHEYGHYVQLLKYKCVTSDVFDFRTYEHNFLLRGRFDDPDILKADKLALEKIVSFLYNHFSANMAEIVREADIITGKGGAAKRSWSEYAQESGQYLHEGAEQMDQRASETGKQIQEGMQSTTQRVKEELWQTREKAAELAQKTGGKAQEAMERARDSANQAAGTVQEKIQQAVNNLGEYTKQTGESINESSRKEQKDEEKGDR